MIALSHAFKMQMEGVGNDLLPNLMNLKKTEAQVNQLF